LVQSPLLAQGSHRLPTGADCSEIPIRLRKLFARELGSPWERLLPTDKPEDVYHDLDFAELVSDAQEEFAVSVSTDEIGELDGSFDSLVRCVASKLTLVPKTSH
jgi:hypothetical protein